MVPRSFFSLSVRFRPVFAAWWPYFFLLPACLALAITAGWPLLRTVWLSMTDASLMALDRRPGFVGLDHYRAIWADPSWWLAVRNTICFALLSVSLETILGIAIACLLAQRFRGQGWLRAVVLIPWAIPTVVSTKIWGWMLHDLYGLINHVFIGLGVIEEPVVWLADPVTAMGAVIAIDVWKTTPFMALLCLAGLQVIPREIQEAAAIDCPSRVRVFFRITLPLLMPTVAVAVVFRLLDAFRIFDVVYVLMGNTPSTATMTVYARQRLMEFQEFGLGSAVSVCVFAFISLFTLGYLWLMRREAHG